MEETPNHEKLVVVKENQEVASSSLQNPSDPDAGYDAHKGKGYQIQLAETYSETKDENNRRPLALITYAEAEPAHHSDAQALKPMFEENFCRFGIPAMTHEPIVTPRSNN